MTRSYFTLPFNAKKIIKNEEHHKCDLKQSIVHQIHLINTTCFGECSFDESFGCSIWEIDFDNLSSTNRIKEAIIKSLLESLKKHEKRLSKIAIEVDIKQEELSGLAKNTIVKKKVVIKLKARIEKTNENFSYQEYFYIGPLSY
ncbi:GPW/gp25 family protein [Tenacibaculum sp.]|nr:GPW/gp25 family protein [Tenacibaculum sp.]